MRLKKGGASSWSKKAKFKLEMKLLSRRIVSVKTEPTPSSGAAAESQQVAPVECWGVSAELFVSALIRRLHGLRCRVLRACVCVIVRGGSDGAVEIRLSLRYESSW